MRRTLVALLLLASPPLLAQAPNGWAPIENGWAEIQVTAPTGTVTTTGTLASGQVALGSGATSVTSNDGLTHQGSGTTFKLGLGTRVFLSSPSAGTLLVEDGSGAARDVQARTGTFGTSVVTPVVSGGVPAAGTNIAGTNVVIQPQPGTGSATGSSLIFQTPTAGASGTTGQTQTTRLTVNETDGVVLPNTTFYRGFRVDGTTSIKIAGMNSSNKISIDPDEQGSVFGGTVRLKGYTVATLPAGTVGDTAYVTDATAPTYLGALTGGGAVTTPVFYNGAAWISH